ncbi:14490_t:CDS:2, partial [Dentiscutata heterogama]
MVNSDSEMRTNNEIKMFEEIVAIDEGIKTIKIQFELLTSFWKAHNYLIDNLVKLLYDRTKKKNSTRMLKFSMDDFEMTSLWKKVIVKCETDYGRANDAIVNGSFHNTVIDISYDTDVGPSNIDFIPVNTNNNGKIILCKCIAVIITVYAFN